MKPLHLTFLSGLVGVAVSLIGIAGYWAGRNAVSNPAQPIASPSTAAALPAAGSGPSPIATPVQAVPLKPAVPAPPVITWTQSENDYLYDLSQALEHSEIRRTTAANRLAIGHAIAGWLDAGADYWGVREKFDAQYGGTPADNPFNREVYIKYATLRFSPAHSNTLAPPPPEPIVITRTVVEQAQPAPAQDTQSTSSDQTSPEPLPPPEPQTHLSNCDGIKEPGEIPNPYCRRIWERHPDRGTDGDDSNSHQHGSGNCQHPDDVDSAGHRCGGRSADTRSGGGGKQ